MVDRNNNNVAIWSSVAVATVAAVAAAYMGYKIYKEIDNLDLEDIFDDMNEVFFNSLQQMDDT